jgi:hypothetical protein
MKIVMQSKIRSSEFIPAHGGRGLSFCHNRVGKEMKFPRYFDGM